MDHHEKSAVAAFAHDIETNAGYLYSTNARLSSVMANRRITDITLAVADFRGKRVLDIGCGDGTYSFELFDRGQPLSMHGIDPAREAIGIARQKVSGRNMTFEVSSAYAVPDATDSFDIAYLRGVLHHMDRPIDALREALRVARMLIVIEPNGYNPILKLIEGFSRYHIEHHERSYSPGTLVRWINRGGGNVHMRRYAGIVPMFCSDWLASLLKTIEPAAEKLPLVNTFGCAVHVFVAGRANR